MTTSFPHKSSFRFLALGAIAALALLATLTSVAPADEDANAAATFNAAIAEMNPVTPEHERLEKLTGTWNVTSEFSGMPDGSTLTYHNVATCELVLENHFAHVNIVPASEDGIQFSGLHYYGYDTTRGKYSLWGADTWGSWTLTMYGDYIEEEDAFVFNGTLDMGGQSWPYEFKVDFEGPDMYIITNTVTGPDGGKMTNLRITSERAEDAE